MTWSSWDAYSCRVRQEFSNLLALVSVFDDGCSCCDYANIGDECVNEWVWSNGGTTLTGEDRRTGRKSCHTAKSFTWRGLGSNLRLRVRRRGPTACSSCTALHVAAVVAISVHSVRAHTTPLGLHLQYNGCSTSLYLLYLLTCLMLHAVRLE